ncbi:ATPase [Ceratobasidium sp. AG-Ba]|nr:ATPase [Ceratobasidium sp. AG-Ba]
MSAEVERPTAVPAASNRLVAGLEECETDDRAPYVLNKSELRLLAIAGIGFFLDAYDLFIINQVALMLQFRYYGGQHLPSGLEGFIKAGANIGSVIGQFLFGYLADAFGRKAVYGKELMTIIFATIMCIAVPAYLGSEGVLIWVGVFRIVLGIGVGGDYPMSASITGDRASLRKRGTMLIYVFANQGWGSFVGSLMTMTVLACFKKSIDTNGQVYKVDAVWRIVVGLSLIPAFGTLYQRLTLPESTRFSKTRNAEADEAQVDVKEKELDIKKEEPATASNSSASGVPAQSEVELKKKAHIHEFLSYLSEWRHAKLLIGTALSWFLVDIAFYGINLNTSVVLQQIGFDGAGNNAWHKMFRIATGNLIITALGFVPGYYVTVLTVERLGRKFIQIQGFIMSSVFLAILAAKFHTLSTPAFIVCFALMQFFFNFGANATTYMYPAELFPTRYRAFAHGISAASGKAGAILASLAFNALSKKIGTPAVMWIFVGCNLFGAFVTFVCLPEVKGRDPDAIELEERRVARENARSVPNENIDAHITSGCKIGVERNSSPKRVSKLDLKSTPSQTSKSNKKRKAAPLAAIFQPKRSSPSPPPMQREPSLDDTPTPKRAKTSKDRLADVAPLAERMRPKTLDDLVGQEHLVGKGSLLRGLMESGSTGSMIFWGPPGSGKTTLARLLASHTSAAFTELSATSSGASEVRSVFESAKSQLKLTGRRTILFVDEIQRFNKAQQDLFLPYIENGWIELVGATTENPSFKLNGALLSRCRVFVLEKLTDEQIETILLQALRRLEPPAPSSAKPLSSPPPPPSSRPGSPILSQPVQPSSQYPQVTSRILASIASLAAGDARTALSLLELVISAPASIREEKLLESLKRSVSSRYDRSGEDRYDMISALHKSLRGSDGSAAMYWLARMLTAGEDPLYIARRLIVVASEDVGLADNSALPLAIATYTACQTIGVPECRINLAHCVAFLAEAPKSTRSYEAYNKAEEAAKEDSAVSVPMVIRNAPTKLMKDLGYGDGYAYNPAYAHPVHNEYLPLERQGHVFLKTEGDKSEKAWDERLLMRWEMRANGGRDWEGRSRVERNEMNMSRDRVAEDSKG